MHRNIQIRIILCISLQVVEVRASEDSFRDSEGHLLRFSLKQEVLCASVLRRSQQRSKLSVWTLWALIDAAKRLSDGYISAACAPPRSSLRAWHNSHHICLVLRSKAPGALCLAPRSRRLFRLSIFRTFTRCVNGRFGFILQFWATFSFLTAVPAVFCPHAQVWNWCLVWPSPELSLLLNTDKMNKAAFSVCH